MSSWSWTSTPELHADLSICQAVLVRSSSTKSPFRHAQEAVEAVTGILGMAACEGSDAVPPNARSHTLLLAGSLIGGVQVCI